MDRLETREGRDLYKKHWDAVILRATEDQAFRRAFLAAPVETLRKEGVEVPQGMKILVHEFDVHESHVILPPLRSYGARTSAVSLPQPEQNGG